MSLIKGKEEIIKIAEEIIKIAEEIAKAMGIEKHEIQHSDRCYDIYILAVREYDRRQKLERCNNTYEKIKETN